jgi:hypothetical protein
MTTNFGTDLASLEEVDETRTVTGVELVAQDIFWRLQTPRGEGILEGDAPNYGLDLVGILGSVETEADAASLPGRIQAEIADDERILTSTVEVNRSIAGAAIEYGINIRCETSEGPFELVGVATAEGLDLAVKLLPGGI